MQKLDVNQFMRQLVAIESGVKTVANFAVLRGGAVVNVVEFAHYSSIPASEQDTADIFSRLNSEGVDLHTAGSFLPTHSKVVLVEC